MQEDQKQWLANPVKTYIDPDRQVIPRWRLCRTTASYNQLLPIDKNTAIILDNIETEKRKAIKEWESNKNAGFTGNLVNVLSINKDLELAKKVYSFVKNDRNMPGFLKRLCKELSGQKESSVEEEFFINSNQDIGNIIKKKRAELKQYERNPISWIDLAYLYTILGNKKKAIRAAIAAFQLAPTNRFVLRSFARLLIHRDEADRAHQILSRAEVTRHDPWLLSAEIAVASAANRTSKLVKLGRSFLENENIAPWHLTELASAIGTLECCSGKIRQSKKLFSKSLINPTENSIAQMLWVSRREPTIVVPGDSFSVRNTHEANAWRNIIKEDWKLALQKIELWFLDQPFSSRPAVLGSYIYSVVLQDYARGIEYCRRGLKCNPENATLLNNYVFSLANLNDVVNARHNFFLINKNILSDVEKIMCSATEGLLHYREGNIEKGREHYQHALELSKRNKDTRYEFLAQAFQALEERKLNKIKAKPLILRAIDLSKKINDVFLNSLTDRLKKLKV